MFVIDKAGRVFRVLKEGDNILLVWNPILTIVQAFYKKDLIPISI